MGVYVAVHLGNISARPGVPDESLLHAANKGQSAASALKGAAGCRIPVAIRL